MACSDIGSVASVLAAMDPSLVSVPSAEQLLQLVGVLGKADALRYVHKQQELFSRCLTGCYKASGTRSSASSQCGGATLRSGEFSPARPSSPDLKLATINGMPSWRSKRTAEDGMCYAQLYKEECVVGECSRLGPWPSLGNLLAADFLSYKSFDLLERFVLVYDSVMARCHLTPGGIGMPLLEVLGAIARDKKQRLGSLGAVLKATGCGSTYLLPPGFGSVVRVGGNSDSEVSPGGEFPVQGPSVCLVGGCEVEGVAWMDRLVSERGDAGCTFFRSRPAAEADRLGSLAAIQWLRDALRVADHAIINIVGERDFVGQLLVAGSCISNGNASVVIPSSFPDRDSVLAVCQVAGISVYSSSIHAFDSWASSWASSQGVRPCGLVDPRVGTKTTKVVPEVQAGLCGVLYGCVRPQGHRGLCASAACRSKADGMICARRGGHSGACGRVAWNCVECGVQSFFKHVDGCSIALRRKKLSVVRS